MDAPTKEDIIKNLANLLIKLNQESSFTKEKILMEKQKEEWPELWHLLEDLMYICYIEDKFISP
jgi:hypothetical protein